MIGAAAPIPAAAPVQRAPVLPMLGMLALIVALQFGPLIGLLGFLATSDPVWALGGASRDALVLALVVQLLSRMSVQPGKVETVSDS